MEGRQWRGGSGGEVVEGRRRRNFPPRLAAPGLQAAMSRHSSRLNGSLKAKVFRL